MALLLVQNDEGVSKRRPSVGQSQERELSSNITA